MSQVRKHAVVTGGAGFMGSHLVERLLADGHTVAVVDSFATGRRENLAHLADNPALTVHQADIRDGAQIKPVFADAQWVFHLAALADIVPSIETPLAYHGANVDGTISVLEAAREAEIERFVYAASSSCYGIPDQYPTPETAPARPMYPYALTKFIAEQYVMHWNQVYGLPAVSLRLFNVYGPRARTGGTYGAVFGVFLAQKLAGEPFTVVGDGSQTRDFTFVTDVAAAFVNAARSELSGEIMNVGSGGSYSVNELVELLQGEVVSIPSRPGEPDCTFADTDKIAGLLGWRPVVGFAEGVRFMVDGIEQWRDAPVWTPHDIARATESWFTYLGAHGATRGGA